MRYFPGMYTHVVYMYVHIRKKHASCDCDCDCFTLAICNKYIICTHIYIYIYIYIHIYIYKYIHLLLIIIIDFLSSPRGGQRRASPSRDSPWAFPRSWPRGRTQLTQLGSLQNPSIISIYWLIYHNNYRGFIIPTI